jgi:streptogramin lyase
LGTPPDQIVRITPTGVSTAYPVPTSGSLPIEIVQGPDGSLWFTEYFGNNIGKLSFLSPQAATQNIVSSVQTIVSQGALSQGDGNSLDSKLQAAINQISNGNLNAARGQLNSFIDEVNAMLNSGKLSSSQAQSLINAANAVLVQIS